MRPARPAVSAAIRPLAALSSSAVALESLLSAATPNDPGRARLIATLTPGAVPAVAHLLVLAASLVLLGLAPGLGRGTRRAWTLSLTLLVAIAALNLFKGLDFEETALDLALAALLCFGRAAFALGSVVRPRLIFGIAAVTLWASVYIVLLAGDLVGDRARTVSATVRGSVGTPTGSTAVTLVEALLVVGMVVSVWFVRSLLRPATCTDGHTVADHDRARELVRREGRDSLSPFILREDKALHFHGEGVLAYRVVGDTAVVSGGPVGPQGSAAGVLEDFMELASRRGWQVVVAGAAEDQLPTCTALGLRHLHIGNEAYLDPRRLSLDGRRMRKVRQSVHRTTRRGWTIEAVAGRDIASALAEEISVLERAWRAEQRRIIGFAMSMGPWEAELAPADLFVLGREPGGELRGLLRFAAHAGGLSLDAMRRVGECPNGLNEALVVRAIEVAREWEVAEVSLNFAGFAHLMTAAAAELETRHRVARFLLSLLGDRFQMERLVRFNEKFLPCWRPRFLVYDSRTRLPRAALRVLQAEAYLPAPRNLPLAQRWAPPHRALSGER